MDAMLLAGGAVLGWFWGFRDGLYLWGFILPPLLHGLSLVAMIWAAWPLVRRGVMATGDLPLLTLVFLAQLSVYPSFFAGRPDHHALLAFLFTLHLGLWLRVMLNEDEGVGPAVGLGLIGALAIWSNVEALIFVTLGMVGLALSWLLGNRAIARKNAVYGVALLSGLVLAMAVEWGSRAPQIRAMDTLSVAHLVLLGLAATFWGLLWIVSGKQVARRLRGRILVAGAGAGIVLTLLFLGFPEFFGSPLEEVDSLYRDTRLIHIGELQPVGSEGAGILGTAGVWVFFLGASLIVLPYLAVRSIRSAKWEERVVWFVLLAIVALYLVMSTQERRWTDYLGLSTVIPYSVFVIEALRMVGERVRSHRQRLARPIVLFALVAGPLILGDALTTAAGTRGGTEGARPQLQNEWAAAELAPTAPLSTLEATGDDGGCDLVGVSAVLMDEAWFAEPTLVLAHTDHGPELLYRTHHAVLSIPNHRHQPGYRFMREVLGHPSPERAAAMLREREVGIVVLCANDIVSGFFQFPGEQGSFVEWLSDGGVPEGYAVHVSTPVVRVYRRDG